MLICNNCGTTNPLNAGYCGNCGAPLDTRKAPSSPNTGTVQVSQSGASGKAIAAMILGLFSIIGSCGPITGIIAIVLANQELRDIRENRSSPAGETLAKIGLWTGWIGTVLCTLFWIAYFGVIFLGLIVNKGLI